jgi:Tfp pilus assembly ATPase PilU
VPAVEILVANVRVAGHVAADRLTELHDEMTRGDLYGMQTFDQSLVHLYRNGLIARADATRHAAAPSELKFALDRADDERMAEAPAAPPPPTAPHVEAPPLVARVRGASPA